MRLIAFTLLTMFLTACSGEYHLAQTISVPGNGRWDYLIVDNDARRVYISHESQVQILDADSGAMIGKIPASGAHGVALAPDYEHGFISNGKTDNITIFNLKTLETMVQVGTGKKPDAIIYEPVTHRVFAFNGESGSATAINGISGKRLGTIKLGGAPEFARADGKGFVFVNLEDKSEVLKMDARTLQVVKRWSVAPGSTPSSMAIDRDSRRLFIGCRNKMLIVMDADSGKVVSSLPLGDYVDATSFDPVTHLIISSTGDGALSIVHQDSPERYRVVQTLETRKGSKTFALDRKRHRLFVPAAQFASGPASVKRPPVVPGSFVVLVYER